MKKYLLSVHLFLLCSCVFAQPQWNQLNSGTTKNLYDVDFYNTDYGLAGGDSGTVLFTSDGGSNWYPLSVGYSGRVGAVHVVNKDTFLVSVIDQNNFPHLMYTFSEGLFWQDMNTDSSCFRALDADSKPNGNWFVSGSSFVRSSNQGSVWDTLHKFTCGTTNISRISFADINTLNGGGLISGIVTYSAYMLRSEDGGINVYDCDPFSFPNSDALTAFTFPDPDTGFIFMNHYNGFSSGTQNSLVKTFGYYAAAPNPPDTMFYFSSALINSNMPGYINDGNFRNTSNGFAACADGFIYESTNGGQNWIISPGSNGNTGGINRLSFPDAFHVTGYAVGDGGLILKHDFSAGINSLASRTVSIYPSPAIEKIFLSGINNPSIYSILDITGKKIAEGILKEEKYINIHSLKSGLYILELSDQKGKIRKEFLVK
jgi:photosystem II stability/assembly factor-like uncharacterized protein